MKSFSTLVTFAALAASLAQAMPHNPFHHRRGHGLVKRDGGNPKFVAAHHMVGNTYPYTQNDWESDIQAAHAAGIDGFALNIGTDSWQPQQIASA